VLEAIIDLNARIHREFQFDPTSTDVSTSPLQVLDIRRGVCQDFAHLMVGCLRSLGLAARYVSGYLRTVPPPGQPRLEGADASHAWVSAWIPGAGWIDFDPTNNQIPTDEHLTLGWGRDFSDVTPLKGVILGGGQQAITVAVDVLPLT
jgi:transglutaminase-like putative cysteine protease